MSTSSFYDLNQRSGLTLRPGDVLYMPRGTMHAASCTRQESMHLTIGMVPVTYADILHQAVRLAVNNDVELRMRLPLSAGISDEEMTALARTIHDRAAKNLEKIDFQQLLRKECLALNTADESSSGGQLESAIADLLSDARLPVND